MSLLNKSRAIVVLCMLSCVLFNGCKKHTQSSQFFSLLKNDRLYDKKSLIWENDELIKVVDRMDSNKIPEGRLGEFTNKKIQTKMGVTIGLLLVTNTETLEQTEDYIDDQKIYQLRADNRFLQLEKLTNDEYQDRINNYVEAKDLHEIPKDDENYLCTYEGLIDSMKHGVMLGTITFFKGESNDIYEFTYAGIGNYTDIKMEKNNILRRIYRSVN